MVTLLTYEALHRLNRHLNRGIRRTSPLQDSIIGGVAGGVGTLVSNPMDVVKTRVMVSLRTLNFVPYFTLKKMGFRQASHRVVCSFLVTAFLMYMVLSLLNGLFKAQPELYKGVMEAIVKTTREEGYSAFFKGSAPRLMHKIPGQ